MPRILINEERCKGCALCVEACPKHIISQSTELNRHGYFVVKFHDPHLCSGCRLCAMSCPDMGIEVYGKPKKEVV